MKRLVILVLVLVVLLSACGGTAATPTESPTATVTTTLSPTPTPKISEAGRTYLQTVATETQNWSDGASQFSEAAFEAGDDSTLLFDTAWKAKAATALFTMQTAGENLGSIEPVPPEMTKLDRILDKINSETSAMVDEMARGIDDIDVDLISSATQRMRTINQYIQDATLEIELLNN